METIVGLFRHESEADAAIKSLQEAGFDKNHLGLIAQEGVIEKIDREEDEEQGTIQAEHKLGVAGGAAVGGLTGLLISVGALAIPGIGPVLAAGSLAMIGMATGLGATAGGLLGALSSQGIEEEEAHFYAEGVKRGGILVVVESDEDQASFVKGVLQEAGAIDLETHREVWQDEGWSGFDETSPPGESYPKLFR